MWYKRHSGLPVPDSETSITYKWQPANCLGFLFPWAQAQGAVGMSCEAFPSTWEISHMHCRSSPGLSFCHSAISYSSMLTSLLHVGISVKSCPLVFSLFPFSTSLFFFLCFSLYPCSLLSPCDLNLAPTVPGKQLDTPLSVQPQHTPHSLRSPCENYLITHLPLP